MDGQKVPVSFTNSAQAKPLI